MSLAIVHSRTVIGLEAPAVTVEVHLANGLPSFTLVGLADTEVKEARERVRAALQQSGLAFPHNKRITVNLAPAELPKEGGRFDLPIALGILAASEQLDPQRLAQFEFAGELSLAGDLRTVPGALALAVALRRQGSPLPIVLPQDSASEAALVPGLDVRRATHLLDVVSALQPGDDGTAASLPPAIPTQTRRAVEHPDLADVRGHAAARRALEIAAAGGHSILLVGPPGSGKSMLAHRFGGLLPKLTELQALESAAVLSLAGRFDPRRWGERPMRAPHHSASAPALVGGGSPPRPGEVSLAHHGTLFLDELPEFSRHALESLREPLETGTITISRAQRQAEFPARFQLIAAMNPCPCGYLGDAQRACRCSPDAVARYQTRVSGPLLDRIDLQVEVVSVSPEELARPAADSQSSAQIATRVQAAREVQTTRQGMLNAELDAAALERYAAASPQALARLNGAATKLGWSSRGLHRALRTARTVADLAGDTMIQPGHVAEAIQMRRALVGGR